MAPRFELLNSSAAPSNQEYDPKSKVPQLDRRSSLPVSMESSWAQKAHVAAQKVGQKVCRSLTLPNDVSVDVSPRNCRKGKLARMVASHRAQLPIWVALAIGVFMLYKMASDGDYSFSLTLSSIISTFSFGFILLKVLTTGSSGVSVKMLHCYQLVTAARLSSILIFSGYLPYDRSGNVVYRLSEIMGFVMCSAVCMIVKRQSDVAKKEITQMRWLTAGAAIFAVCFHLTLNRFFLTDTTWAFGLYLEAIAVLPQLILFYQEKRVEPTITHFLFSQAVSKSLSFCFWLTVFRELNRFGFSIIPGLSTSVGYFVMLVQVAQLAIMGDFVVAYIRALIKGVPIDQVLNVADCV